MNIYHQMDDSFEENCWSDLIDHYNGLLDNDVYGNPQPLLQNVGMPMDVSFSEITSQVNTYEESGFSRKRVRGGSSYEHGRTGTKACRERMRREKLNHRFSELCGILEPGRPVKTDKFAILCDAIRHLNHLKIETQEYIDTNARLMEEIKILKGEKKELREENVKLKGDKERMEQLVNIVPTGEENKGRMFPSYGYVPMWQYIPQSVRDTSLDHQLRPPAA